MSDLPSYVAAAKPVPQANRSAWYKNITPTYAGVMLWFVFWQALVAGTGTPGGVLSAGLLPALLGLVLAALICHFLFYLAPGMLGMQTGFPLYVVGTSTYGVRGGLFMPGLLMGLLQFGWLAVNAYAVAGILCKCFNIGMQPSETGALEVVVPGMAHGIIAAAFTLVAAFVGLKGIQYVARVATYLPLIPVVVLVILLAKTVGGLGGFTPDKLVPADLAGVAKVNSLMLPGWMVVATLCTYIVGFFATAGAAGVDIAASGRDGKDVQLGGLGGIVLPTIFAGGAAMLVIAGAYGANLVPEAQRGILDPVALMPGLMGPRAANIAMIGLAISSFPGACFSAFIAVNSFKTTMPNVNPFISIGIGALIAVLLAVTGVVGKVIWVFVLIGASFGPVCGAMLADYLLAGRKWPGPHGFNPAGWISWFVGFAVGAYNLVMGMMLDWQWAVDAMPHLKDWQNCIPVPPVAAFIVGFVLYLVLSGIGLRSRTLDMPAAAK